MLVWQVTRMEFVLLWATYLAIMYTDLERGIGAGIVMATLYFAYSYAQVCSLDPLAHLGPYLLSAL
jgi:SulP family sulfate permease